MCGGKLDSKNYKIMIVPQQENHEIKINFRDKK